MSYTKNIFLAGIFGLACFIFSCGSKVYSFEAHPSDASPGDSIKVNWKVRGKPYIEVHEKTHADDPANIKPGERLMEFLIKFKNSTIYQITDVRISEKETTDTIFFNTTGMSGDTLFASGYKSPEDLFSIVAVESNMERITIISHENKTAVIPVPGSIIYHFNDTRIGGPWTIGIILLPAERRDPRTAPTLLKLLIHKKHI